MNAITTSHVALIDGALTTTTHDIAEVFGKQHRHVLTIVKQRMEEAGEWGVPNFRHTPYTNPQNGQTYPVIRMTEKGFLFVVGKFTGAKATQAQIAYADEFERMRNHLQKISAPPPAAPKLQPFQPPKEAKQITFRMGVPPGTPPLTKAQQALVNQRAYALSHEAFDDIREYLRRKIANECVVHGVTMDNEMQEALRVASLNEAMTYKQHRALAHSRMSLEYYAAMLTRLANDMGEPA